MIHEKKVLVMDIETAPMIAYVWGKGEQHIAMNQIKSDWYILAWAAKWLGEGKIMYADLRNDKTGSDAKILPQLWQLLDQADAVVTQNGQSFDGPKLNARFILNGMKPPSPYEHIDTYRIVKRVAKFSANSLEYLTDKLCTRYKKLSHSDYPGMELWKACLAGDKKAWIAMQKYNEHDVLSTEELYLKVRSWAPASMPSGYVAKDPSTACRVCGTAGRMTRRGMLLTRTGQYQRYQCQKCAAWVRGEKV